MLIIGLTGGIGSGKTTVAHLFAARGVPVIDTDAIAHQLTQPEQPILSKIEQEFGPKIMLANGQLNRPALARLIFSESQARHKLEQILHPAIWQEAQRQIDALKADYCLLVIPLLIETGQTERVDRVLVVDTTEALQLSRTLQRDQRSEDEIKAIMHAQVNRQTRLQAATDIIDNSDTAELSLENQVEVLHKKYLALTQQPS